MAAVIGPRYSIDADAQAFITAAGLTNQTQINAINLLVINLKGYNIWSKFKSIYPFVGGTATTHKWNLKDPRDLDAAFRLTFSGGWTHSATGALPNGTNAYANTYQRMKDMLFENYSFGLYINSIATNGYMMGTSQNNGSDNVAILHQNTSKVGYVGRGSIQVTKTGLDSSTHQGMWALSGVSTTKTMLCSDGTFETISPISDTTWYGNPYLILGAINSDVAPGGYYNGSIPFAYVATGLTQSELTLLRTTVINFQTTLKRNV